MSKRFRLSRLLTALALLLLCLTMGLSAYAAEEETEAGQSINVYVKQLSRKVGVLYNAETNQILKDQTGIHEYPAGSGKYYAFRNKKGQIYMRTAFKLNGKNYYAGVNGVLAKGWKKFKLTNSVKQCYYDPKTMVRSQGWKQIDGKTWHYFTKKGALVTGLAKLSDGYVYYLDPARNGARTIGWKKIDKKRRYFDAKGRMQTGLVTIDGKTYYLGSGYRKTGLRRINGKTYFFNKSTGVMVTGWLTYKGKRYYLSSATSTKGQAVTGWLNYNGSKYYFNSKGAMVTGWLTLDNKKYYFNPSTGKMTTGKKTIDGKTYDFGTNGYLQMGNPDRIEVNLGTCVVTIYSGSTPIKAMLCSPGLTGPTPTGTFYLGTKHRWQPLFGNVYGQFTSTITGNILFHSVYYYEYGNNRSLNTAAWNKLGQPASAGCVRLKCGDAYYIYTNCPIGTKVHIFRGNSSNDPLGKPSLTPISTNYDPTDPFL
ncbi:MAG: L,D-transpeptidase family protein [Lachnospiraceae bacterium]|nr:L,D-transpeptidase family protein [Lachnospiraceae bacterium]